MHPEVRDSVAERLQRVFADIQRSQEKIIGTPIRSFVTDLVVEALEMREEEWRNGHKLDPGNPSAAGAIGDIVEKALRSIAADAAIYTSKANLKHMLLIGVVEQTHKQFCKIFPFCR